EGGIESRGERDPHSKERSRLIKITRQRLPDREGEPSEPSNRPKENKTNGLGLDSCSDSSLDSSDSLPLLSELPSEENTNEINASDGSDSSDSKIPTQSNGGRTCIQCNAGGGPLAQVEGVAPPAYPPPP